MSLQGILLLDFFGIALIILILNLVRTHKLHAGFGVIWLLSVVSMIGIISIPSLLEFVTKAVGAIFPASALTLLAFVLVFGMLIFFSMQISILSARQVEMAQKMALKEMEEQEKKAGKDEPGA